MRPTTWPLCPSRRCGPAGPAGESPLGAIVAMLYSFGAVTGRAGRPVITALGRWAAQRLEEALPSLADPEISAAELIAEGSGTHDGRAQRLEAASGGWSSTTRGRSWKPQRSMPPLLRTVGPQTLVMALGEGRHPGLARVSRRRRMWASHARFALYAWEQEPEPDERDLRWLAAESAAAALDGQGPDEALCVLWESVRGEGLAGRLAVVRATGHPAAGKLERALNEFTASGVPWSIDQGVQLKVTLKHGKPAIWRSVRLPAPPLSVTCTR